MWLRIWSHGSPEYCYVLTKVPFVPCQLLLISDLACQEFKTFHILYIYRKQGEAESSPLLQQSQQQQQQQQQQMVPLQDTYMQSRAEALHNVESTIHELGSIFTQLATMVSQQGEIAIRFVFLTPKCVHCLKIYWTFVERK